MIHLRLFGAVDLTADGRTLQSVLAQPKRLALLAYLAASHPPSFHRRDRLLALFWPESGESQARSALGQALYFLRRSLGDDVLVNRGEEVGTNPEKLGCDVSVFEAALDAAHPEAALGLYRGEFLDGFHLADAPEFQQWMDTERERLRRRAVRAAGDLSDERERAGHSAEALRWARRVCELAPDEEAPLRRLLTLLDQLGERAEAVCAYEAFAQRLRAEYELEPSAETQALIAKIRSSEDSAEPAVAATVPATGEDLPSAPTERLHEAAITPSSSVSGGSVPARRGWSARRVHADGPHKHWRAWVSAGAAAVILVAGALVATASEANSALRDERVLVAAFENRTGDPGLDLLGHMAADWISQGLQRTGLTEVIDPASALVSARQIVADSAHLEGFARAAAMAREAGAGAVIWGGVYRQADSLYFRAQITDVENGRLLLALDPVSAPLGNPVDGAERLRERVAGALSTIVDKRIASLSASSSRPPTFDAYREYVLGLERFVNRRYDDALFHFESASRLDTTFALPLIWAAMAHGNSQDLEKKDSVLQLLGARRERLSPVDRYALEFMEAEQRADLATGLVAVRQAARLAPGSNWSYMVGILSLSAMRPREAVHAFKQVDPEHGWAKGWHSYWIFLTAAHHHLGQHKAELEIARQGVQFRPENLYVLWNEIRALVALGRVDEAVQRMNEVLLFPPAHWLPGYFVVNFGAELRAHGHAEAAAKALGRAVEWFESPAAESWIQAQRDQAKARTRVDESLAWALYSAGRWAEARSRYERLAADRPGHAPYLGALGRIAAREGRHEEARRIIELLEPQKREARRWDASQIARSQAAISALLGERDSAVRFFREWTQNDLGEPYILQHMDSDFDGLRHYRPFQAAVQPKG